MSRAEDPEPSPATPETPGDPDARDTPDAPGTAGAPAPAGRRGRLARLFRTLYGESPLHLVALLASFALCGYAASKLLQGDQVAGIVEWFVGAALIHDLVLVPLYGGAHWVLHRSLRTGGRDPGAPPAPGPDSHADADPEPDSGPGPGPALESESELESESDRRYGFRIAVVNHIRVPAFLSLLLLLVYWPLISQDSGPHYQAATLLTPGVFLGRWLLITAAVFAASALVFAARWARWTRRGRPGRRGGPTGQDGPAGGPAGGPAVVPSHSPHGPQR